MRVVDHALEHGIYLARSARSIAHFRRISAIAPTCNTVLNEVVRQLPQKIERMIEVGAGGGGLVRKMLEQDLLTPHGTLLAVEPDPWFIWFMQKTIQDKRVQIEQAFLHDLPALTEKAFGREKRAQIITTSIPLSILSDEKRKECLSTLYDLLEPDGELIVYIIRDITQALSQFFPFVSIEKVRGHMIPPMHYRIQHAYKTTPILPMHEAPAEAPGNTNGKIRHR